MSDYPPLTPLDVMPLHGGIVDFTDAWYPCQDRDREPDWDMIFDWRCMKCVMAAERDVELHGDRFMSYRPKAGDEPMIVQLSWLIARARALWPWSAENFERTLEEKAQEFGISMEEMVTQYNAIGDLAPWVGSDTTMEIIKLIGKPEDHL